MRAVKDNRVLTIRQEPTSKKKDAGQIGFYETPHASYLIFPEPLPKNKEAKVIGVKYELIAAAPVKDPVRPTETKKPLKPNKSVKPAKPAQQTFSVTIRRVATVEAQISIEAKTKAEAEKKALHHVEAEPFPLSEALYKTEIRSIE